METSEHADGTLAEMTHNVIYIHKIERTVRTYGQFSKCTVVSALLRRAAVEERVGWPDRLFEDFALVPDATGACPLYTVKVMIRK